LNQNIKPDDMLRDLVESVCILQKDGLNYSFTHRSFQEYFSAFCMSYLVPGKSGDICKKIARRYTDNVIYMLYDMNHELLETEYILVMLEEIIRMVKNKNEDMPFEFIRGISGLLLVHRTHPDEKLSSFMYSISPIYSFMSLARRMYASEFAKNSRSLMDRNYDDKIFSEIINISKNDSQIYMINIEDVDVPYDDDWYDRTGIKLTNSFINKNQLSKLSVYRSIRDDITSIKSIHKKIKQKSSKKLKTINEIFSLN